MPRIRHNVNLRLKLSIGTVDVIQEPAWGWAISHPTIVITPGQTGMFELDTVLHESLHMSRPDLSEEEVCRVAGDLAKVAWAMGYRRPGRTRDDAT